MRNGRVWWHAVILVPATAVLILGLVAYLFGADSGSPGALASENTGPVTLLTMSVDCTVSGHTRDSWGDPLPDVMVYADGWYGLDSTRSRSDGYFKLTLDHVSDYWLFAYKSGWDFPGESLKRWEIVDGMHYTWNLIGTWKGLIISGHVRDARGTALQGVEVALSGDDAGIDITDANGYYDFRRLDPGSYTVTPAQTKWAFRPGSRDVALLEEHKRSEDFTARLSASHVEVKYGDPGPVNVRIIPPETGTVRLRIVSVRGQVIWQTDRFVESSKETTIEWSGRDNSGREAASGVYMAAITGAGCDAAKKLVIIR